MDKEELLYDTAYMALHIIKYCKEYLSAEESVLSTRFADLIIYLNADGSLGDHWKRIMDSVEAQV